MFCETELLSNFKDKIIIKSHQNSYYRIVTKFLLSILGQNRFDTKILIKVVSNVGTSGGMQHRGGQARPFSTRQQWEGGWVGGAHGWATWRRLVCCVNRAKGLTVSREARRCWWSACAWVAEVCLPRERVAAVGREAVEVGRGGVAVGCARGRQRSDARGGGAAVGRLSRQRCGGERQIAGQGEERQGCGVVRGTARQDGVRHGTAVVGRRPDVA